MPPKKKLSEAQVMVLSESIKMGAPYSEREFAGPSNRKGRRPSTEDTNWWAFQPIREVKTPALSKDDWSRNAIDKFILQKLNQEELVPTAEASRPELLRRVYLDLIGLPPGADELRRFSADNSPDAYEKVVEQLLQSPYYGERWARQWLDLVRYAESDGYKLDAFRPNAWRYRDYVIRSLNSDKPYNRFLMEQIAADELWPEEPEAVIGLSFLRLPIYEYNQRDVKTQWASILNDITDVTGDAFLGLGMQCARCHDHKFDPILQRDYFGLQAFFAALQPRDSQPLARVSEIAAYKKQLAQWEEKTVKIREEIAAIEQPMRQKAENAVIAKFPKDIQAIMHKAPRTRTPYEQQIHELAYRQVTDDLEKLDSKFKGEDKAKLDALYKELAAFDDIKPKPLPDAMLVSDIGPVAPPVSLPKDKTHKEIGPAVLNLLGPEQIKLEPVKGATESTGRRAALAKWLGSDNNRFTARVMVNRIWQRHFGQGLVANLNDFGHLSEAPTHPELLDWLAKYFITHNWSLKSLHRLMVTSAAYRQSSRGSGKEALANSKQKGELVDPQNRWLWRQNLKRLDSDQIRDELLYATGELDLQTGGPSVDASKPRRTIYVKWLRNSRDALLEAFDPPDAYITTPQRNVTTTPMQSLVMINGSYVLRRAQMLANRIERINPEPEQGMNPSARPIIMSMAGSHQRRNRAGEVFWQSKLTAFEKQTAQFRDIQRKLRNELALRHCLVQTLG